MKEVVVVGYARTPFGAFQGSLAKIAAPQLGATAIKGALDRAGVKPEQVSEVIMGNVLPAGTGQAPARQAMMGAGIPQGTHALTVNKVCGSGMKAVMLASQSIRLGESDIVVAGGMENMSQAPYLLPGARDGFRMGEKPMIDSMINDGLWDPYNDQHMGNCAELCAREKKHTREEQDNYAADSFRRAQAAQKDGKFNSQIVPVEVNGRKGDVTLVDIDEGPSKVKFEKIPQLRPVFDKEGSVTAANASTINDGAAALVLTSAEKAKELGLKPLAKLTSYATHSQAPEWFTTAPVKAIDNALSKAGWSVDETDLFEVNEAFAVVALSAEKDNQIPHEKMNVWGGAISVGHPIGASGARIVLNLIAALEDTGKKKGCAAICIGGGEATAICVERD